MIVIVSILSALGIGISARMLLSSPSLTPAMIVSYALMLLVYWLAFSLMGAVYQSIVRNHLFASSEIVEVATFTSRMKVLPYALLMVTNVLLVIFTLGFGYPFAKVRKAAYLASVTDVQIQPGAQKLIDQVATDPSAFGEEAADFFIVTDDLVKLLEQNPDAILSVLLHEIGHVEHQHSLKLVAQSMATSVFFGDIEGAGEIIIGAGSSLLQNAFSRDMEAEADEFAFSRLIELGISPAVFADALQALIHATNRAGSSAVGAQSKEPEQAETPSQSEGKSTGTSAEDNEPTLLEYLSTHPLSRDRIETARERVAAAGF
ncbi:MAG: DUF898 family protein [Exilibacterium sp.]